jgi:hypothetical protein
MATQLLHSEASGENGTVTEPVLELDSRLKGRVRLETILHEALHLACPWMPERVVLQTARYLAMVAWHLEYRSPD